MADFSPAYEKMILDEGGYKLHKVPGDPGGLTYAGISRRANPGWSGWPALDRGGEPPAQLVYSFYKERYWDTLRLDEVASQRVAETIFNFGVNAGVKTTARLAQLVIAATPDGIFGPRTLAGLNMAEEKEFEMAFALAKLKRYADICNRDRTQSKFLLGWLNRTLRSLA